MGSLDKNIVATHRTWQSLVTSAAPRLQHRSDDPWAVACHLDREQRHTRLRLVTDWGGSIPSNCYYLITFGQFSEIRRLSGAVQSSPSLGPSAVPRFRRLSPAQMPFSSPRISVALLFKIQISGDRTSLCIDPPEVDFPRFRDWFQTFTKSKWSTHFNQYSGEGERTVIRLTGTVRIVPEEMAAEHDIKNTTEGDI